MISNQISCSQEFVLGAHGIGRRHIKNSLISRFSEKYEFPTPHTSRKRKDGESAEGGSWKFVSEDEMLEDVLNNKCDLHYMLH
jgi:guanylate kinase